MKILPLLLLACLVIHPSSWASTEPVLRILSSSTGMTNRLRNGHFELVQGTRFSDWTPASSGYLVVAGEGRSNSTALVAELSGTGWRGASQSLTLNRTNALPVIIRGWSRAENISGSADSDYSLYVDIVYSDGTPLWGQTGNFRCGTHDWEKQEFTIIPEKPIKTLSLYCLLRRHTGKAWFDDVSVEELQPSGHSLIFQGAPMVLAPQTSVVPDADSIISTEDGLSVSLAEDQVIRLQVDERNITSDPKVGGFLVRDVAANSDIYPFEKGSCLPLGLKLQTTFTPRHNHLLVEGRVSDTRSRDRAIMLLFALPVKAGGWRWHDDIRRSRLVEGHEELSNTSTIRAGTTGALSVYPMAAIEDGRTGLALAMDMARPAQYRLVVHAGTGQFFIAYDFGLSSETQRFPGAADFRFVIYRFDAHWGFRAAWDKLMAIFPDHFKVRSRRQGIWMPFTDVSTVEGWQDFGFRYHEGNNNVAFDDRNDILSFRYTEPMTWWMSMAPELPRTEAEALRVRDSLAQGPVSQAQRMALISQSTAMTDAGGHPWLLFRNEPWANGAVWSLNPNPYLPASPNAATIHWNEQIKTQLYGPNVKNQLDGEYLDSLEGYVTADLNYRREHFMHTTVPLSFDSVTHQPALCKGLAVFEFTRWISEDLHQSNRLVFANGVPYRFSFLCPWLDVLGTETDWLSGNDWRPSSHGQMALWRTLSGAKPYLLLMNSDYERLGPFVERYFQRSLLYGMFPSMFSHNAAENPYWRNPRWYNRDRALFRKYLPVIRRLAESGWQPVTKAFTDNSAVLVERFGSGQDGMRCYSLYNDTDQAQTAVLTEEINVTGSNALPAATELISGSTLPVAGRGWKIELAPGAAAVVYIGPRLDARFLPNSEMLLEINPPVGFTHVLEFSKNLQEWQPIQTNTNHRSPYTIQIASASDRTRYYRLRW